LADFRAEVVSSSVWAGASSPIILELYDAGGRIDDTSARVTVQLSARDGTWADSPTAAAAVQPFGVTDVSYVARPSIPGPGWWSLAITATSAGGSATTRLDVAALDPGNTPSFGAAAPTVRTPTLADVGGDIRRISTDPIPDRRLYGTSTADALAAREPFVLVIDSTKFRTSPACGKALVMARYLQDRWPSVPFIHLEPFEYSIVSDTAVLTGTLSDPTLVPAAAGWGIAGGPWLATSMPWIFIVDGNGLVRGKYQGVIGSADIDVLVALIEQGG
jgi:hypothetical protein